MQPNLIRKPLRDRTVQVDSSRANIVIKFAMALIGAGLIALGIWGFGASADWARQLAADPIRTSFDQLAEVAAIMIWLVMFAPCLGGGALLLWCTFAPEHDSWLVPFRTFNFILAYKILRQTPSKKPHEESCIDILPLGGDQKLLRPPESALPQDKDS
jgi:hypothetical protein